MSLDDGVRGDTRLAGRPRGRVISTVRAARPCKREKVTQNLVSGVTENGAVQKD
jgi:hypothetical protein